MSDCSLSSVELIQNTVRRDLEGFSMISVFGDSVNNLQFGEGYREFERGIDSRKSYIWQAISAVGEDLGNTLFENVMNYIDNVSNVDVCRVKSLKSMMKMVDIDYQLIEKIDYYPLEIQKLIDILSINKKYLFNNRFIRHDFIETLSADQQLTLDLSGTYIGDPNAPLSSRQEDYDSAEISSVYEHYLYDEGKFNGYLLSTYENFLLDMLNMRYTGSLEEVPVFTTIDSSDGYLHDLVVVDKYSKLKKQYNVDPFFNVVEKVNDIEIGNDSLENYFGAELELLKSEMKFRESPITTTTYDLASRYSYYRKQKVIEYAKFIDNTYIAKNGISDLVRYNYDPNYFLNNLSTNQEQVLSGIGSAPGINVAMVHSVAEVLVQITTYLNKLREMIRFQARKIYMKGTNNLLKFTSNEFLIDYINYLQNHLESEDLKAFVNKLSAHSVKDVLVQEYWDQTEYMNISTDTSKYALDKSDNVEDSVNPRYFDDVFSRNTDGKLVPTDADYFEVSDINEFYLSTLGIGQKLNNVFSSKSNQYQTNLSSDFQTNLSSDFYEFLSVLFDIAADSSFYDKEFGIFGTKLSNSIITRERTQDLNTALSINNYILRLKDKSGFEFLDSQTVKEQIDGFTDAVTKVLSVEYLSAISDVYDLYYPTVENLSVRLQEEKDTLSVFLNTQYDYYFCKSDNTYCYDEDGNYMFDYFIGNPAYNENDYHVNRLSDAYNWINDDHCKSYSVLCVTYKLQAEYSNLCSDIYNNIVDYIILSGYNDVSIENLATKMDDIHDWLKEKVTGRTTYLQNALENFRSQAQQLKTTYDGITNNLNQVLANLPDTSQGYAFTIAEVDSDGKWTGAYKLGGDSATTENTYDCYSGKFFKPDSDNRGKFDKFNFISITSSDKTIPDKVSKAKKLLNQIGQIYMGKKASFNTAVTDSVLNSINTEYSNLYERMQSIVAQVKELFQLSDEAVAPLTPSSDASGDYLPYIDKIIEFLGTKISEVEFSKDLIVAAYNSYLKTLSQLSVTYDDSRRTYESMWISFKSFFEDYEKTTGYEIFTYNNLLRIENFTNAKDKKALDKINTWFEEAYQRYDTLMQEFTDTCQEGIILYDGVSEYKYLQQDDILEICLADLLAKLILDVQSKEYDGNKKLERDLDELDATIGKISNGKNGLFRKYFPEKLGTFEKNSEFESAFESQVKSFLVILQELIDELDYTRVSEYNSSKQMFQNYTGLTAIADDPYYNAKNQIHPSYQIHPFLWRFIEKNFVESAFDKISQLITTIYNSNFIDSKVAETVNNYIGEFGNVIDVWKMNTIDFSGYSTRYEQSDHLCRYTNAYSEVVDYDGVFYPPAIDAVREGASTTEDLWKYYSHLNFKEEEIALNNKLLEANRPKIFDVIREKEPEEVYDIFKYQLDKFGNCYSLLKKYDSTDADYQTKLHTKGTLWIRLCDNPIGFPVEKANQEDPWILDDKSYKQLVAMEVYDFEILPCGSKIVLTYLDKETQNLQTIQLFIGYSLLDNSGYGKLILSLEDPNSSSVYQTREFPDVGIESIDSELSSFKSYVGMYSRNDTAVDVVYIQHQCGLDDEQNIIDLGIPDKPLLYIYTVSQDNLFESEVHYKLESVADITNPRDNPPIAFYQDLGGYSYLELAFILNREIDEATAYKNRDVDLSCDVEGPSFYDTTEQEMNSFDAFSEDIAIIKIKLSSGKVGTTSVFNTNADIGYVPAYTGDTEDRLLDFKSELSQLSSKQQAVTLLGNSKNIDQLIDSVNDSPDPYLTKEQIYNENLFGRVYENGHGELSDVEFNISADKTLNIFSNPSLFPNMEFGEAMYQDGKYYWTIVLRNAGFDRYEEKQLSNLKIFAYNTNSLGRNPYIVEMLSSVMKESERLAEDEYLSANYTSESRYETTTYSFETGGKKICVSGSQNGIDQIDGDYSNKLYNISNLRYKYINGIDGSPEGKAIRFVFDIEDITNTSFIEPDTIKVALINEFDLTFYSWYHFMDPGATIEQSKKALDQYTYAMNKISGTPLRKEDLLNLDLGDYTYLSDVQVNGFNIFDTNRKLSFKTSEEDLFPISSVNYYIPSLNIKYPFSFGQYYNQAFVSGFEVDPSALVEIFTDQNVFVFNGQEASVELSDIGDVKIDTSLDSPDEYRVFEDYLSVGEDGRFNNLKYIDDDLSVGEDGRFNNLKYIDDDPLFYQFVHFASNGASNDDVNVPENVVKYSLGGSLERFEQYLDAVHLTATHSEELLDGASITNIFRIQDLDDKQKEEFYENIKKFLKFYINYKRDSKGITLYVNYQNYINSPYIKVSDGKPYVNTIPSTFARIEQGQTGTVDIVVQFRQYNNSQLIGCKNLIAARYQIQNISDDKPKFILKKLTDVVKDEEVKTRTLQVQADEVDIQLDPRSSGYPKQEFNYSFTIKSNVHLKEPVKFSAVFSTNLFQLTSYDQRCVDASTPGILTITLQDDERSTLVKFKTTDQITRRFGKLNNIVVIDVEHEDGVELIVKNGSVKVFKNE